MRMAVINMSRDNTCSNKIKIGCGHRWKRHSTWHVHVCAPRLTRLDLLLLVPKRKQSPVGRSTCAFPDRMFHLLALVKPYSFIVHVRAMLHGLCCMSILQARSLGVDDWSHRLVIFYSSTACEMSSFIK